MSLITLLCLWTWSCYLFPRHALTVGDLFAISLVCAILMSWGVL